MEYRITQKAKEDLLHIGRYTERALGRRQRDRYLKQLVDCIEWLASHPNLGQHRPDIDAKYYCFPQGQHLIFYMKRGSGIAIIGVIHKRMDVKRHIHPGVVDST